VTQLNSDLLDDEIQRVNRWPTYLGITGLLLLLVVVLAGGIIWYNTKRSESFAIAAASRLMQESEDTIRARIKLLYDPMFAIVGVASLVDEFTTPTVRDDNAARARMVRALRVYPQILSLYVGFDSGDFFMVTHLQGPRSAALRERLQAPASAVFAVESITTDATGQRQARWSFLAEDGKEINTVEPLPATFDPRVRPWYRPAKESDGVVHSDLYIFASSGEPGFTVSRSFAGATPGVMGADLAAKDLSEFLREQQLTPSSLAFIFNKDGEIIAMPDQAAIAKAAQPNGDTNALRPPKIADLRDPVVAGLVSAYDEQKMLGVRTYDVAGRTYIARVARIPERYGRDQLLALAVPVDEIVAPIIDIRNETLLYSVLFLVFALPLYATLMVAWIDRRLRTAG
jgi:hypothetical protein